MVQEVLSAYRVGDMVIRYLRNTRTRRIGLQMFPASMEAEIKPHRELAPEEAQPAEEGDCLIHVAIAGLHAAGGYSQGRTMRHTYATNYINYVDQSVSHEGDRHAVSTRFKSDKGFEAEHVLSWYDGDQSVEIFTRITNVSETPLTLEMITSFSLGYITPFADDEATERLKLHRFRSAWVAEGRLDTQTIEQLNLERSRSIGVRSERFGQVGNMPCRGFFPTAAIEDTVAGVLWGAQLYWAGSWQMEAYRKDDFICLSGGQADREFGHWMKTLASKQTFTTPAARVSCVKGDLEQLCQRLTAAHNRPLKNVPAPEQDLPILYNEYCSSWAKPTHASVVPLVDRLVGTPIKYFVIDGGWYKPENGEWYNSQGDWIANKDYFPGGLKATADYIRSRGMIPGIWFEWENVGSGSAAYKLVEHMVKRDGVPLCVGPRRFWDLTDAFSVEYLTQRVINLIRDCGFGYLKIDYNDHLGIGVDGAESLGEGLRRQVEAYYALLDRLRAAVPDLIIENCASGGHRLEPSLMTRHAMASFSDAHESIDIPLIAANVHNLILPRQSQIWAVLRKGDSAHRLFYTMSATFLGRMCLSGEVHDMSAAQWKIVDDAMSLYQRIAPIIRDGFTRRLSPPVASIRQPRGYQAVLRTNASGNEALLVVHSFAQTPRTVDVPLPEGNWKIAGQLLAPAMNATLAKGKITIALPQDFTGGVVHLVRA